MHNDNDKWLDVDNVLGALELLYSAREEAQAKFDRCDQFLTACKLRDPAYPADAARARKIRKECGEFLRDAREPVEIDATGGRPAIGLICGIS
jgi:hypothetical protein